MIKKNKETTLLVILIGFSLLFFGLDKLNLLNWLKRPLELISNPIKQQIFKLSLNSKKNMLNQQFSLEEVNKLKAENANLTVKIDGLEKENSSMKKLLGAPLPPAWKFIPALVLNVNEGIMTINQGSEVGIKENQTVVWENVLIGKIIKVNPFLSLVALPINKDLQIKAKVKETNVRGVVKAQPGDLLILDQVLPEFTLVKDQIVVTSGEDTIFPSNLIIGKIDTIDKEETAVYQQALVKPILDYQTLEEVFVVIK